MHYLARNVVVPRAGILWAARRVAGVAARRVNPSFHLHKGLTHYLVYYDIHTSCTVLPDTVSYCIRNPYPASGGKDGLFWNPYLGFSDRGG
jgi:hypothetical protein